MWLITGKRCKFCGGIIEENNEFWLASDPPKRKRRCKVCGRDNANANIEDNTKINNKFINQM